ncbi:hypothetical protein BG52_12810 [Paenibacillus darwinianus]|nr:hypothetical protein BG52_12810 [Paenibacillus darwinianus]EXX92131.1 hypothetical protein CH50_11960 [Paenibacillus darwinianus]
MQRLVAHNAFDRADLRRVRVIVRHGRAALGAEYLDALVVAVNRLAAVLNDAVRAACEFQHDDRRVHIAVLREYRIDQHAPLRVHLFNLAAGKEAGHIEIVNHHIHEKPAGQLDIVRTRRIRITRRDAHDMRLADRTGLHMLAQPLEVMIEPAVEADLQFNARLADSLDRFLRLPDIHADRLLAKNMLARLRRLLDERNVRVRRGAYKHRVDIRIRDNLAAVLRHDADAALRRPSFQLRACEQVTDRDDLRFGKTKQIVGVNFADAARADDSDSEFLH